MKECIPPQIGKLYELTPVCRVFVGIRTSREVADAFLHWLIAQLTSPEDEGEAQQVRADVREVKIAYSDDPNYVGYHMYLELDEESFGKFQALVAHSLEEQFRAACCAACRAKLDVPQDTALHEDPAAPEDSSAAKTA